MQSFILDQKIIILKQSLKDSILGKKHPVTILLKLII